MPITSIMVCLHCPTPRPIPRARQMKWLKVANGLLPVGFEKSYRKPCVSTSSFGSWMGWGMVRRRPMLYPEFCMILFSVFQYSCCQEYNWILREFRQIFPFMESIQNGFISPEFVLKLLYKYHITVMCCWMFLLL